MNCIECFHRDGEFHSAEFIVNGQGVCQKHIYVTIRGRGDTLLNYTWVPSDSEPVLEPFTLKMVVDAGDHAD